MSRSIGKKVWAVADIPEWSEGPEPELKSHGSLGILNACDEAARRGLISWDMGWEPKDTSKASW